VIIINGLFLIDFKWSVLGPLILITIAIDNIICDYNKRPPLYMLLQIFIENNRHLIEEQNIYSTVRLRILSDTDHKTFHS
jgi:hypothetical protein